MYSPYRDSNHNPSIGQPVVYSLQRLPEMGVFQQYVYDQNCCHQRLFGYKEEERAVAVSTAPLRLS